MKNKLIPMTDFVLYQSKQYWDGHIMLNDFQNICESYAKFLKQPLKLEMFVPCDDDGNVLEEPEMYGWLQNVGSKNSGATEKECIDCEAYHAAKNKVLFEGLTYPNNLSLRKDSEGRSYWLIKFGNERYGMKSEKEYNNIIGTVIYCDGNIEQLLGACLTPTAIKMIYGTNI